MKGANHIEEYQLTVYKCVDVDTAECLIWYITWQGRLVDL